MDLLQARKKWYELRNLVAPRYNNEFSYAENDWEKIKRWVEQVTGQLYVMVLSLFMYNFYYDILNCFLLIYHYSLDAFESLRNPQQNNCHEREWTGDYLIPLIK